MQPHYDCLTFFKTQLCINITQKKIFFLDKNEMKSYFLLTTPFETLTLGTLVFPVK